MSKALFCLAMAAFARADDFELEEEYYGEPRLLDGVFNNTSIDLNSILALVLIGILALVTLGPSLLGGGSGSGYGNRNAYEYNDQYYQDYYNENNQFYQRQGHFDGPLDLLLDTTDLEKITLIRTRTIFTRLNMRLVKSASLMMLPAKWLNWNKLSRNTK